MEVANGRVTSGEEQFGDHPHALISQLTGARKLHQKIRGFCLLNQRTAKVAQRAFSMSFVKKTSDIVQSVTGQSWREKSFSNQ